MNNIEILENFIDKQKSNKGTFVPTDFEIKSLENMIKEYKELKEKISKYEKQLDLDYVEENYISKSKVKEKIEEIKRNDYSSYDTCLCLQELLEEGE